MGTIEGGVSGVLTHGPVTGTWGVTENNRKARFYALMPAGKKQLAD